MSELASKSRGWLWRVALAAAGGLAALAGAAGCGPIMYGPVAYGPPPAVSCTNDQTCVDARGSTWYCEKPADGGTEGVCQPGQADAGTP